jgi:hypothetical protein
LDTQKSIQRKKTKRQRPQKTKTNSSQDAKSKSRTPKASNRKQSSLNPIGKPQADTAKEIIYNVDDETSLDGMNQKLPAQKIKGMSLEVENYH